MLHIRFINAINQLPAEQWNALLGDTDYPFIQHGFLSALEQSGAVGEGTGWQPHHLLVLDGESLVAAMPLYLKSHSYGEYVFDQGWAQAYQQHGLSYYPKLVAAIPFTPAVGPRVLTRHWSAELAEVIHQGLVTEARRLGASSWHVLFDKEARLAGEGSQTREGVQFHWFNQGYQSFEDFLATFKSRKRKAVNKERQLACEGLEVCTLEGSDIPPALWQRFYLFYQRTYLIRSGHGGYLSDTFFHQLGAALPAQLLLVAAFDGEEMVAASLFLKDSTTLYGRYWGALGDFDRLHFECCYYRGIEYCIRHGLARFDAGAQGEHKVARGFEPVVTQSQHWLAHPGFFEAVGDFVAEEKAALVDYREALTEQLPYRQPEP